MNESTITDDRDFATENRIERLAEGYVRASGLNVPSYTWLSGERGRWIADCVRYARRYGQIESDEQEQLFRDCLNDLLPKDVA